ncbi:hypothetical protein [Pelosinus sp. sgz500959]|uniref:hypothetical protein n=1 Tax=Pelosinus sp. sgz500959 TaxID=3242472 RepID=UPI0036722BF1
MTQQSLKGKSIAISSSMKISPPNPEGLSIVAIESQGSKVVAKMGFDKALLTLFQLKARDYNS